MNDLAARDFFTDHAILRDPYAYFEAVRAHGSVYQPEGRDYVIVTGFDEFLEVSRNSADFSSAISLQGAAHPLPFTPQGSDITAQIEAHRTEIHGADLLVNLDDNPHANMRALVNALFVPSRLKAAEAHMAEFADRMVRDAVAKGQVDLVKDIATPFVTWVVADMLGVPEADRQMFMDAIAQAPCPGNLDGDMALDEADHPFAVMGGHFAGYIMDRLTNPQQDVLTELAHAVYPDGTKANPEDMIKLGMFMFGAGQDTSAKLLTNAMRYITDIPGMQDRLRADPAQIAVLLEEVLRLEGSTKQISRVARRDTVIGGVPIKAGTKVLLAMAAANRDPKRWEAPNEFRMNRPKIREHVAFGRSAHTCAGAPLARAEVRVILEKFFEHTAHIDIDPATHGPVGARDLDYEPSFIIRGLSSLIVNLTPVGDFQPNEPVTALAPSVLASSGLSTAKTTLKELLGNDAASALLDKHFPGVSSDKRIGMAKGMTLRSIQKLAPDQFSDAALDALDADLAAL